jgi:cytochrome P450
MAETCGSDRIDLSVFEDLDVFGAFDVAAGHELDIDPYPVLAELRRRGPILPIDLHDPLGVDHSFLITAQSSGYTDLDAPTYSALSYQAVDTVLRNSVDFNQEIHRRAYAGVFGQAMNTMDEPEHRRNRNLVEKVFTRRSMEAWSSETIVPLARQRAERLLVKGPQVDLVHDFIFWYPGEVITRLLGLPDHDIAGFMRMAVTLGNPRNPELSRLGSKTMTAWISAILEERRAAPAGDDALSLLLAAEIDGQRLTDEEIASFIRLLFPAGFETTYRSLSNLMVGLLTTGQWELLRRDRSLVPQAVEEGLRWEAPLLGHPRLTVRDIEVCGVPVPEGAVVHAFHASANRDESRWEHPDEFDITRPAKPHSTFGFGVHMCIGKHLARAESIIAVNTFLDLFPDLRLASEATEDDYRIRGLFLRSPARLPVTLG